jgi:hypothetical protein
MSITWETLAYCAGKIIDDETGKSRLVQTDWDYPGVASSFGWSIREVQCCPVCGEIGDHEQEMGFVFCTNDDCRVATFTPCEHRGTDGTVECKECKTRASAFIYKAGQFLADNDGATADDPGYFA